MKGVLFMYRKGYGRMTLAGWLHLELENCNAVAGLVCGALVALGGLLLKLFSGSPYPTLLALGIGEVTPPVWIMVLLWTVSLFTVGASMGLVLSYRERGRDCEKYRAGMFFLLLLVLEFLWYPVFFGAMLVFLSALLSILILCCAVVLTVLSARINRLITGVLVLHDLWLIYLLIFNFAVLFRS